MTRRDVTDGESARAIAMLRAVNVNGRNRISMAELTRVFVEAGADRVRTYLQSGNVAFNAPPPLDVFVSSIERMLSEELDVTSTVILRTSSELADIVRNNPYLGTDTDPITCHVTFLAEVARKDLVSSVQRPRGEVDEFSVIGGEVFLRCTHGYGQTKLTNAFFEKALKTQATTRNWRTVTTLLELSKTRG